MKEKRVIEIGPQQSDSYFPPRQGEPKLRTGADGPQETLICEEFARWANDLFATLTR